MAATASGGETMAPSVKATAQPRPGTAAWTTAATTTVVARTRPIGERQDRARLGAEVADRREEGRDVEQRRQEQQEDEIGREADVREAGHEADQQPAEDQHDRVRDGEATGQHAQRATATRRPRTSSISAMR